MDMETLIKDFSRRGIRLLPDPPKLAVEPAELLTDADREVIRRHKVELLALLTRAIAPAAVVEATFAVEDWAPGRRGWVFPDCPSCNAHRFWIGRDGKVVCSTCGHVRYVMVATQFHEVQ